jgi:hypothetical protein
VQVELTAAFLEDESPIEVSSGWGPNCWIRHLEYVIASWKIGAKMDEPKAKCVERKESCY